MNLDNTEWRRQFQRLHNEKGTPCLSIVTPAQKLFTGNRVDVNAIHRLVTEVKNHMLNHPESGETEPFLNSLEQLSKKINYTHGMESIGLFLSKNINEWVPFYFPVKEKLIVAHSFDTRDLLYQDYYAINYHVLLLSKEEARLFTGVFNQLNEVKDAQFPLRYEDDYEYSRPTRGLTYEGHAVTKDFEKEKSQLQENRSEKFLQQVNDLLQMYMDASDPLILTGGEQELVYFGSTTKFSNLIGRLHGNFLNVSVTVLGESTWKVVKMHLDDKKQKSIRDFEEKLGSGKAVSGIVDCWKNAFEGNAALLLLEKDFTSPGYQSTSNPDRLHATPPDGSHKVLSDVVSKLIGVVQEKRGEIMLLDNGALNNFQHVGLIKRY